MSGERISLSVESLNVFKQVCKAMLNFGLFAILFFSITNTLFSFPLDKLMIVIVALAVAFIKPEGALISAGEFIIILSWFVIAITSSIVNITLAPMIYFPIIGLICALVLRRHPHLILTSLYYALIVNIIFGLVFDVMALAGLSEEHVTPVVKGFTFLYSPRGFTATVQTYGTLCITWFMLYQLRKKLGMNNTSDKFLFIITTIGTLASFNRTTLVFWMVFLFFKYRKLFFAIILSLIVLTIKFWNQIIAFITNVDTLVSRSQMLQGFDLSYVKSNSILVYLFGRGTNQYPPEIVKKVKLFYRSDIENGYAMLLHSYGAIGLLFYIIVCGLIIFQFLKISRWSEAAILFFYFFITQYFTQEFVSVTFDIFLVVMLLTLDVYSGRSKLSEQKRELAIA